MNRSCRKVQLQETGGELALHLPARPSRLWRRFGALICVLLGFLILVVFVSEGWTLAVVGMGAVVALILSIAFASLADAYLTETFASITVRFVVVKKIVYGKETIREFALEAQSRARQWYAQRSSGVAGRRRPRGIEIGPSPYDAELGSDWRDESLARFGDGLSRGELDLVEWRINRFLNRVLDGRADAVAPLARSDEATSLKQPAASDAPPRCPKDTKIGIERHPGKTRIIWPNTVQTRSFSGVGAVLFGMGIVTSGFFLASHWQRPRPFVTDRPTSSEFVIPVLVRGVFSLIGLAFVLQGMTLLFGRKQLVITPQTITYRSLLCGIGLRQTLRTAEVISVGLPQRLDPGGSLSVIAPAQGCVIRTAERELYYGGGIRPSEAQWIMSEVGKAIKEGREGDAK